MRKALLICGIAAAIVQVAANVITPFFFPGYDTVSQTVSELSAIGAPTRGLWIALMAPYTPLLIAFAIGVWMSANGSRALRLAAVVGILHPLIGAFWPPMHLRGAEVTLTDTLHILWTALVVPLMMLQIIFAAAGLVRGFRIYSALTLAVMIGFGILTGIYAPNIATNGPTPFIGVWERILMGAQTLWLAIFAVTLLRR